MLYISLNLTLEHPEFAGRRHRGRPRHRYGGRRQPQLRYLHPSRYVFIKHENGHSDLSIFTFYLFSDSQDDDFPDDPKLAFQRNVMEEVRKTAVTQIKKITGLVDTIAKQVIANSVEGEEHRTNSAEGMQMIMSK